MTAWDVHTHLNGVDGRTPDERMANLLRFADRLGVERVTVMMGFPFLTDPTPDQLRRQNDQVLQALAHYHDRAFGFVYLSGKHPDASLRELDRCVKDGPMVGVKLWVARRAHEAELDALVARAAELKAPILQHTWFKARGNLPGESNPLDLAALAKRHPKAAFVCGHAGGDWPLGVRAVRDCPNVVAETSGSDPTTGMVEMAVRELGADRVLFGSDAGGRTFASQLAKVRGADVPDDAKKLILKENLKRLLTPILTAKGVKP
jgi:predicted TIM-barrel fold metal-dependent hydrolase